MNVYDSAQILLRLAPMGYVETATLEKADLVIVNTCTIRAKAEQKAFSFLGRTADLKKKNPKLIVAIGGCVAQQEGAKIIKRAPYVDLVFGTRAIGRLPAMVARIEAKRCRVVDVETTEEISEVAPQALNNDDTPVARFVTIMRGCDNYCTYCVVPYVRGGERSRRPETIVAEVKRLVESGVKEITLLGQNVNSYGQKEGLCSFAELLGLVHQIEGLARIRFTTSHPKDLSADLMAAFTELPKLCTHIHLPVQSGSDRVLRRMHRKYTSGDYRKKVKQLRSICPEIAITSDFIVGFPGETEADFEQTLSLMATVEFDGVFAFKYSDRDIAPAARFKDKVAEDEKDRRLQVLLDLQGKYTLKKNKALMGKIELILIEGLSKRQTVATMVKENGPMQWSGRTSSNKIVNCTSAVNSAQPPGQVPVLVGRILPVKIEKAFAHSLKGRFVSETQVLSGINGGHNHAV
jgi:tRNA-2-methylthio-N6-dimethylallyladenosine synthase